MAEVTSFPDVLEGPREVKIVFNRTQPQQRKCIETASWELFIITGLHFVRYGCIYEM